MHLCDLSRSKCPLSLLYAEMSMGWVNPHGVGWGPWGALDPWTSLALCRCVSARLGLLMVPSNVAPGRNFISLRIGSVPDLPTKAGSYSLEIGSASVVITGSDPSGVFYAVQSLLSLADSSSAAPGQVPLGSVHDSPRFEHRGQHVDVSRNFHSVEDLKRLMDAMALYKLNRLHIHLGDDEGWRLEIPGILELTQVVVLLIFFFLSLRQCLF